jgi:polysaccharide pyruvyl transferase WcaK-like protein
MKILIANAAGFGNVGDDAIRDVMIENIKKIIPDSKITCTNPPPHFDLVLKNDIIIVGGGGLLYDVIPENVENYMRYLEWGQKLGKATICLGIGNQGIISDYGKNRYREILNKCDLITGRDQETVESLKNIGIEKDIKICADVAWLLKPKRSKLSIRKKNRQVLGIVVFEGEFHNFNIYRMRIEHLLCKYKDVFDYAFFIFSKDDDKLTRELYKAFGGTLIEYEGIKPAEYLSLIENIDMMFATRYHPFIFSILSGIPICIGDFGTHGKIGRLGKLIDYGGLVNIANIDQNLLENKF